MIKNIITYSVKNKLVIAVSIVALIFWGIYSLGKLSIDAVPDITNNQVQILTTTRNLSTLDVEQFISYPIEMEMANLPGVKEIRSSSKYGLSVVTIVFDEDMGTFLPRQLIQEKLKSASDNIPEGFGEPEMGPISTGLGEIYQYILDVKPEFKDQYTDMDLRTIQDWIVKRQLTGIDGVVEVNTWGGHLKQFEVSIDPQILKAMNVKVDEIMSALENNNSISGAGYIEKNNQSYFIRAEGLLKSLEDIKQVFVKNVNGKPIYISDIAKVKYGHAPRFGAITGNGEGEKVLGQVMLLKGANTKNVLEDVIARVEEIQPTLPEGVFINPFLERSALLKRTTSTVAENLILGALIVIFVVILLLGNIRSGLIIASVIPLSLLFALGMMNLFGVSANLMSLGAIDFGIIIDGAIIIVEFLLFSITRESHFLENLSGDVLKNKKDEVTIEKSSFMMRSAIFGQIIILIVFLPILTLEGVEGKMFRPMGMTFSFALVGAMLLCLTYVPMMAAYFMKPASKKINISDRFIEILQKMYVRFLNFVLKFRMIVVSIAILFMAWSFYIFSNLGAEFVPVLDEGDIAIQPLIMSGTSLSKTIEICTMIEKLLLEKFPEIDQVVTRIGAAEVPTDPMSMEEADVMVTLKPKSEWTSATNTEALVEKMKHELATIPGMDYEFMQPIEMRFNELISGASADISVKIYGEDLDILFNKAVEAKELIDIIDGAADVVVDKVEATPQVLINFNRSRIAQYGLSIKEINETIQMAYAGLFVGEVFDGEKRFDLVMRYKENSRNQLQDISKTLIDLDNGNQVPLREVAEINFINAPAKISRDDTKRRVSVGVNVRNRDLESVVIDIKNTLRDQLNLPSGYHVKFGGQFENLASARKRLAIVVPVALILIFLLLYMTFHSVIETVLIYTAIPLSATGGILLLWIRGMPFSISAGIGFIALFGIAVLNGIVLIEHYKTLSLKNFDSIKDLVIQGTKHRIRPVLLTASAAALGFLPMAISSSAGAEVQRPLATAVIGGLITSTILTLIILPLLYTWLLEWRQRRTTKLSKSLLFIPLMFSLNFINAQNVFSLEDAIDIAIKNNPAIDARQMEIDKNNSLKGLKYQPGSTQFAYIGDALFKGNSNQVHEFSFEQNFEHPKLQKSKNALQEQIVGMNQLDKDLTQKEIALLITQVYYELQKANAQLKVLSSQKNDFQKYSNIAKKRLDVGAANQLEWMNIQIEINQLEMQIQQVKNDKLGLQKYLQSIMLTSELIDADDTFDELYELDVNKTDNLMIQKAEQTVMLKSAELDIVSAQKLPSFNVGYGIQKYYQVNWYSAIQIGVDLPLFNKNFNRQQDALKMEVEIAKKEVESTKQSLKGQMLIFENKLIGDKQSILFYKEQLDMVLPEMMRVVELNYQAGSASYLELVNVLKLSLYYNQKYLDTLLDYKTNIANYEFWK